MAKKRPTSRPKGSGKAKSENLLVRLSAAEKKAFSEAAELAGIPVSAWVRERLRWAAVKELQSANRQVPFLTEQDSDTEGDDGLNG